MMVRWRVIVVTVMNILFT